MAYEDRLVQMYSHAQNLYSGESTGLVTGVTLTASQTKGVF